MRTICRVLKIHPSGYYAWLRTPYSQRYYEHQRLLKLIKQFWLESGCVYGYRKVYSDLMDSGESCGKGCVERLMRKNGLKAQVGYRKRKPFKTGKPAIVAPNILKQNFSVEKPNQVWVIDITYIRTREGWLYLAVVIDLFSRQVIGWSMQSRMETDLVIKALLMALWRRKPERDLIIHSDQGSQFTSHIWTSFLKAHHLQSSMSRRGNCYDNAAAETFFQLLKRERIKRKIYLSREEARHDIFDYIELFYNPKRKHGHNNLLSPVDFEKRYFREVA